MKFNDGHLECWYSDAEHPENSRYDLILQVNSFPVFTSKFIKISIDASKILYYSEEEGLVWYFLQNNSIEDSKHQHTLDILLKDGYNDKLENFQNCSYAYVQKVANIPLVPLFLEDSFGNVIEYSATYLYAIELANLLKAKNHSIALRKVAYSDNSFYFEFAPSTSSNELFLNTYTIYGS